MDRDDFFEWLEDPVTVYFQKYLLDAAKQEVKFVSDAIFNGDIVDEKDQIRFATMSIMFQEIAGVTFDDIESFYKE